MRDCVRFLIIFLIGLAGNAAQNILAASFTATIDTTSQPASVTEIIVTGNEHTKDLVILREMKTEVGDIFNPQQIEFDRLRITSLGLFTRVEIYPQLTENGYLLIIDVSERWYIFPLPIFYFNEKDWEKISYGLGLLHSNFRGRNEQLSGSFWLGYNPGYRISYSTPWLFNKRDIYASFYFSKEKVKSKSTHYIDFYERYLTCGMSIGRRFGYHFYFTFFANYRQLKIEPPVPGILLSGGSMDKLPSAGVQAAYDTRDFRAYPKRGWLASAFVYKGGFNNNPPDFWRYGFDVRRYQIIFGEVSVGVRTAGNFSTGVIPVYERVYLGYSERIRGHFTEVMEGDNRLTGSAELRFPIMKIRYFTLNPGTALLKGYASNLKFGVSGGLFFDMGAVWFDEQLTENHFRRGFGAGLHFHLPYIEVLRVEYAWDGNYNGEYIIDIDVAF